MRSIVFAGLFALSSCAPTNTNSVTSRAAVDMPAVKVFATPRPRRPVRSNREIARDFMDLTFRLESGRTVPVFTRFEGPIEVRLSGDNLPATITRDLETLLRRLRNEAGIPISRTDTDNAQINIEIIPARQLKSLVPNAACFVVPGVATWDAYKKVRRSDALDWTQLQTRSRIAVFLPSGTSPQEMRDCLHEEVAQGLGPLNDLYRLSDSTFNDDNFHTVLTGFDMLILRATYAPELRSGMSPAQVRARLPAILARLNPRGQGVGNRQRTSTPRTWSDAVTTALSRRSSVPARIKSINEAMRIAQAEGWTDARSALGHFIKGRLHMGSDNARAFSHFRQADAIYATLPDAALQRAHVGVHMAAFSLTQGDGEAAVAWVDRHLNAAQTSENAALLATLMMLKAEGLSQQGRASAAQLVRVDSLGWARYGFGTEKEVSARLKEIASLSPQIWRSGG